MTAQTLKDVAAELYCLADMLSTQIDDDAVGPWPKVPYKTRLATTNIKLNIVMHPARIRARADKLLKQTPAGRVAPPPPKRGNLKRECSQAAVFRFIQDDEMMNAYNYAVAGGIDYAFTLGAKGAILLVLVSVRPADNIVVGRYVDLAGKAQWTAIETTTALGVCGQEAPTSQRSALNAYKLYADKITPELIARHKYDGDIEQDFIDYWGLNE